MDEILLYIGKELKLDILLGWVINKIDKLISK